MRKIILAILLVSVLQGVCFAGYTGLIVDASDLGIEPGMSPKIYDIYGNEVYGTVYMDAQTVSEKGLVNYAENVKEAIETCEVGSNPLVIRAIDNNNDPLNVNIVVSEYDAEKIIEANIDNNFLGKRKIAVVL